MDESLDIEIDTYACRVCLTRNVEVASLFTTTINSITLSEMFTTIVPMIEIDDTVPHSICTNCIANLVVAYEFHLQSIKSDADIRIAMGLSLKDVDSKDHILKEGVSVEVLLDEEVPIVECPSPNNFESTENKGQNEELCKENSNSNIADNSIDNEPSLCSVAEDAVTTDSKLSENSMNQKKTKTSSVHQCSECEKSFDKLSRLQRHAKIHTTDGKPWSCENCPQRFANLASLLRHQIKHSNDLAVNTTTINNKPDSFQCNECQKVFNKQESLASHMKMHRSDQKEYFCEFCPKSFSKMNKLTRHAKIHDEMKSHKCNICDRTFALGGQLIDHMNKHKNVKPHVCTYCNKGFQQSCTLKDHIRIHTRGNVCMLAFIPKTIHESQSLFIFQTHLIYAQNVVNLSITDQIYDSTCSDTVD